MQPLSQRKPRIGLVLGSGAARGWAHIGVIRALEEHGIAPDIICGTSIGALVGATYGLGVLDDFEAWVRGLGIKDVVSFMDLRLDGGMLKGERLMDFFRRTFQDRPIEELKLPFGAVATSLHTGAEIWLRTGSTVDAVRASIALPGLFSPVWHGEHLLADGGLVNPVPVSLARAMGAEILIAVDLNADLFGRHFNKPAPAQPQTLVGHEWMQKLQRNLSAWLPEPETETRRLPSMLDVLASSINIMQVRITRSRMVGEPPDVVITPRLAQLGLLDFHRARQAIEEGARAAKAAIPTLVELGLAKT
ncbi:patatin-like phospholipase RssA [Parapusillimonas granuli]|uniref:Patatin-like phospholipase RssA n=1 Tax=Parapusillimonas granuli TaxID=380911 RepID=A0A853FWX0_9BURK|nr:patatin-like phospholipase RssA [Parapusillimonas granuli]MBB5213774.1 NTE family protein [Parapusillimonas granuli]MEB2398850.1 patatin-like phospholipase RssA [Alcaligenaceae bacterium]NYT48609.1 patatin-like phospholipase RssA [Parapusillimonas granuli]